MSFKKIKNPRGLEITSLIDVVFLLLIFFLVSFAFSLTGTVSESKDYSVIDLPKTETELPVIKEDRLENLLVQIVDDTTGNGRSRIAYVLWPSFRKNRGISRSQALQIAREDSTFAAFPEDFLNLTTEEFHAVQACTLISNSIARYVAKRNLFMPKVKPIIEVRAERNTEFKILNFIMQQASSYEDRIPQIIIRTTSL